MNFIQPDAQQITEALGDITKLRKQMHRAITRKIDESFQPVPIPGPIDWLSCQEEKGQTMAEFKRQVRKAIPHGTHKTIYIQPFGSFNQSRSAPLRVIFAFARAFFDGCDVELLSTLDLTDDMTHRIHFDTLQYHTHGFYKYLNRTRSKRNSRKELLCVAVTMVDIYPNESWNFVYGEAATKDGFGVYSFARLDPLYLTPAEELKNITLSEEHRVIMLRRCVRILLHEIGHLFGLKHCIYYNCLMNGMNHEKEMDRQALYLCPVCLHKLYSSLQFDIGKRYDKLAKLCEKHGLKEEAVWYRKRLDCIRDD